jgi:hypothetical protein
MLEVHGLQKCKPSADAFAGYNFRLSSACAASGREALSTCPSVAFYRSWGLATRALHRANTSGKFATAAPNAPHT